MALFGRTSERDERRAEAWKEWLRRRHPFAIASLVLGVISLIEFGVFLIFGIAGMGLGIVALVQLRQARSAPEAGIEAGGRPGASSDRDEPCHADAEETEGEETERPFWEKTEGDTLAWWGISLSALSLIVAGVVYTYGWS